MSAQPIDFRTAQHVATEIVRAALAHYYDQALLEHGDEYTARNVRSLTRPGSIDGLIVFTIEDETRGPAINVTLQVGASPVEEPVAPVLRLAGPVTDPGSVIRARVGGAR